nr:MAG TPA: hypothetical protein [Caudoviricetes sp.]
MRRKSRHIKIMFASTLTGCLLTFMQMKESQAHL